MFFMGSRESEGCEGLQDAYLMSQRVFRTPSLEHCVAFVDRHKRDDVVEINGPVLRRRSLKLLRWFAGPCSSCRDASVS
jgi:hypothetical protein